MRLPDEIKAGVERLGHTEISDHFALRFALRNPLMGTAGKAYSVYGVRNLFIIAHYVAALEKVYDILTSPPFSWAATPLTNGAGKTEVYILYLESVGMREPFTAVDRDWIPYVCLPCRSSEPMLQNALHRAQVEAVHETTHVFCWSARRPRGRLEEQWFWFNEATAVYIEGVVFPGNLDSIRFALDWCDFPEWPLDEERAWYQAGFFARYLAKRFGPQLIAKMWNESKSTEGPFDALNRLLPAVEASDSRLVCRVFGDYAHDSYFLWDHKSAGFHNEVYLRFSHRALTECFVLAAGEKAGAPKWTLDHLACRYFRIEVAPGVKRLEVVFRPAAGGCEIFRCYLTAHKREQRRGEWKELNGAHKKGARVKGVVREILAVLEGAEMENCDWFLLTVANCGIRSKDTEPFGKPHDDQKAFVIEIRASA